MNATTPINRSFPPITYPDLPVAARRGEILAALTAHRVLILCGETGSGKTTQIPKMCLEIGLRTGKLIGCTQPRRIAARTVAARIAQELGGELGGVVGYKVRFTDKVRHDTAIKIMTDGILLAESQGDPLLSRYDTIIIDEAHERSLNIDFLLGYLKGLIERRTDLRSRDRFGVGCDVFFFDRAPAHFDRVSTPGDFDHRCVVEVFGEPISVDGRGGNHQPQVSPPLNQPFQITQQKIDIEAALVRFVDDDRIVA